MSRAQSDAPSWLSGRQKELYRALCGHKERLGPIYAGGLRVLEDDSNPDRLAQSAHSMRELMEKIGSSKRSGSLTGKVRGLEDPFRRWRQRKPHHFDASRRRDKIDPPPRKLLVKLDEFFEWFARIHPTRKKEFEQTMIELDYSGQPLPEPLVERNWKAWGKIWDYFVGVCHGKRTNLETHRERIAQLETYLADRLLPRTAEDWDAIDDLIKEARDA